MPSVDINFDSEVSAGLNVQIITTDTTTQGVIIDTKGAEALEFLIYSGTITDGTYTPKLEDGDDAALSDAADIDSSLLTNTIANATFTDSDDNAVKKIGVVNHKRYVRLSLVSTGTSSGGTLGAVARKADLHNKNISL